ncbi:AAA family ATPase [Candidatus Acetothermia bacterium]|nr:AAA family ATPase [Candidatus Acetothermia bacterium]MBI3644316.1 AAA family ATPase [Candidatus Acetothermia bacterium]
MIQLRFLGKTRIDDAKGQPMQLATRKTEQVLAYLWLKREAPQSRERMAVLFWPDSSEEKARASLRNAIFELNKKIPTSEDEPLILTTRTTAQFNRKTSYWMDVEEFEKLLKSAEDSPQGAAIPPLREAVALYHGDFLEESYDDWVLEARDYFRELYLNALRHLVRACKEQEDYPQAITYAKQSLAKNALQEEVHRDLMLLYYALGDRNAALQTYQDLTKLLQTELEVEPLPETQELYKLIFERASASVLQEKSKRWKELVLQFPELGAPFIGRVEECGRILSAWDAAAQGKGQAILVSGEAGSGKTRLAQEVVNYIQAQGGLVLTGQSYESEGQMPYQPWMEILRQLFQKAPPSTSAQFSPLWLSEVIRLLPEISEIFPEIKPRATPLPLAQEKNNLFEAISQMLLQLSQQAPLTIYFDDLQWADPASLQLLHYLAKRVAGARILVLGMHRSEPEYMREGHPLKEFLITALKDNLVEQIALPPLSNVQISELVQGMLHTHEEMPPEFVRNLEGSSRGNAFFVVELVQSYLLSGAVYADDKEGWHVAIEKLSGAVLPPKVEAVVEDRLRPITSRSRDLLNLVSTRSRAFDLLFLKEALERPEEDIVLSLEELLLSGLLSEQAGFYQFRHDVIREVVYGNLLPERKRRLHLLAGRVLEGLYESKAVGYGVAVIGEIADHFSRAKDERNALRYSLLAGEYAWNKSFSKDEAIYFYNKSLELAKILNDEQALGKIYGEIGRIYTNTDKHQEGIEYCLKALEIIRDPVGRAGLYTLIINACRFMSKFKEGINYCDRALAEIDKSAYPEEAARIFDRAGVIHLNLRDFDAAIVDLNESSALLDATNNQALASSVYINLGNSYSFKGDLGRALLYCKKGLAISEKLGDPSMRVNAYFAMGHAYSVGDDPEKAISWWIDSVRIYQQMGDEVSAAWVLQRLAMNCIHINKLNEALEFAMRSVNIWISMNNSHEISLSYGILGSIHQALGQRTEASRAFDNALMYANDPGLLHYSIAICFSVLKLHDEAINWLQKGRPYIGTRLLELAKTEQRFAGLRSDLRFQKAIGN